MDGLYKNVCANLWSVMDVKILKVEMKNHALKITRHEYLPNIHM